MNGLWRRGSARRRSTLAPMPRRSSSVGGNGGDASSNLAKGEVADLALKLPILEAEILGLRQLLAEMTENREDLRQEMDDLRRERDHWQNLAMSAGPERPRPRSWFCGRATPGARG